MQSTLQLLYVSHAAETLVPADLQQIIAASRRNNWRAGITGCLVHAGQAFAQVLEGRPDVVEATIARIAHDPRHHGLTVVRRQAVDRRDYPDWSMGWVHDASLASALDELLVGAQPASPGDGPPGVAWLLRRMASEAMAGSR